MKINTLKKTFTFDDLPNRALFLDKNWCLCQKIDSQGHGFIIANANGDFVAELYKFKETSSVYPIVGSHIDELTVSK